MDSTNIIHQEKVYAQRRRNRTILRLRLCSGVKAVITRPLKSIPVLLLCIAFILFWCNRNIFVHLFDSNIPLLSAVWSCIISALLPLFFLLLLIGLLYLLGTPFRAKAVENSLSQIGLVNRYGHAPALVSCGRVKGTNARIMAFSSFGVGLEKWENLGAEIQDALNIHLTEPLKYGGRKGRNRNIIVITAAPGAPMRRKDTLYDDEL